MEWHAIARCVYLLIFLKVTTFSYLFVMHLHIHYLFSSCLQKLLEYLDCSRQFMYLLLNK